jgi:broad specificity phosphatase PhoE
MNTCERLAGRAAAGMLFQFQILLHLLLFAACGGAVAAEQASGTASEQEQLAQALRMGGVIVLIRHSVTDPGVGDPPGFELGDCSTQRNLSDAGRGQASRIGQWFKQHAIEPTVVRASPWCRTRETAMLAFERFEDWSALSNLLGDRSRQEEHARQVREAIAGIGPKEVAVLVSHGVTINAFIGEYLRQGELVVVRPAARRHGHARPDVAGGSTPGEDAGDEFEVVGRLLVP